MRIGSLFAGIGGFDLGFERAGWISAWQVEKEPFCRAVLETRFPEAKRFEDVCECGAKNLEPVECITAGVPCQDVSVAGKRAGLAGERTGLFYEFARILRELRPAWFVFENVPGLLSSNNGRDFAEVQRVLMVECGYGILWRILDSQFFGVAQRRRRVFIVGRFGKPCPAEILFERESGSGDIAKGRAAGEGLAGTLEGCTPGSRQRADGSDGIVYAPAIASALRERGYKGAEEDIAEPQFVVAAPLGGSSRSGGFQPNAEQAAGGHLVAAPITASYGKQIDSSDRNGGPPNLVAQPLRTNPYNNSDPGMEARGLICCADLEHQKRSSKQQHTAGEVDGAMRGTDDECAETDPDRVRDFAGLPKGLDSARYRALGNAVTVEVAHWIAKRILSVSECN